MVSAVAIMITLSLLAVFRLGIMFRDQAAKSQLRADYHQREESLMRAIVAVFPQKAIDCMKADYVSAPEHSWDTLFSEAVAAASAGESLPAPVWAALSLGAARRGDVGDRGNVRVRSWITSLEGVAGRVTPGTADYAAIFDSAGLTGRIPPLLTISSDLQTTDAQSPVVSTNKVHATQAPGLLANINSYPGFNLIPYPDVRFGYAVQGQPFVSKRNWWAFEVRYGAELVGGASPVPVVAKRYILSLYEIPSQMPIEAATFAEVGRHRDGTEWNAAAIQIDGSVYADRLRMSGSTGPKRVTGRRGIEIQNTVSLDGVAVAGDFDAPGVREQFQVDRKSDAMPVALSSNSGRLAFLPLQRGGLFLHASGAGNAWEKYTRGADQCVLQVTAIEMVSLANQMPMALRVGFLNPAGTRQEVVLRRGNNWPSELEPGGQDIPFQTELTLTSHTCLSFYPERLNAWLLAVGGASVQANRSLYFKTDATADPLTVRPLPLPDAAPGADDMSVIIRKGKNLSAYVAGLSLVTPLRIYVGDDLNSIPQPAPPAGSGLAPGVEFFPPLSVFAGELRIGTTTFVRPFEHHGQMGTLVSNRMDVWQPLDIKSGADDLVHSGDITAQLRPLRSPAELPPVHQMNWLVTIEEISGN